MTTKDLKRLSIFAKILTISEDVMFCAIIGTLFDFVFSLGKDKSLTLFYLAMIVAQLLTMYLLDKIKHMVKSEYYWTAKMLKRDRTKLFSTIEEKLAEKKEEISMIQSHYNITNKKTRREVI
jgi:hypothetical protein